MKKNVRYSLLIMLGIISMLTVFTGCEQESVTPEPETTGYLKSTVIEGEYVLFNRNSYLAADLNVNSGDVSQYSYWGGSNQQWRITAVGSGYYKICPLSDVSVAMDVAGQSTVDGANVQTYSYWGGYNQQFLLNDLGTGYYSIINRNSGKALDVYQSSTENSANINQWTYWGGNNQQWRLEPLTHGGNANGQLSWTLTTSGVPSDVLARITEAMDAAVARYNSWGDWAPRTLTVEYNTGVATADGNINGNIRFGASSDYQNERTALHEIAHTYGVGTSSAWSYPLIDNYDFVGSNTVAVLEQFDGPDATISTGGSHFWPYGLNYNSEWSIINANRHVQLVYAMCQDGLYSGY